MAEMLTNLFESLGLRTRMTRSVASGVIAYAILSAVQPNMLYNNGVARPFKLLSPNDSNATYLHPIVVSAAVGGIIGYGILGSYR